MALERATVEYDEKLVAREQIDRVVQKLGYEVIPEKSDEQVDLKISGMTCAACAARIEKKLNSLQGIKLANVNLATEQARVLYQPGQVRISEIIQNIQNLGYNAERVEDIDYQEEAKDREIRSLRWLFITSAVLSLPLLMAMVLSLIKIHSPLAAFLHHPYFQLLIATPVQFVIGARFYKQSYLALRAGSANMDVLVAMGTSAAYFFSLYNVFFEAVPEGMMKACTSRPRL